MGIQICVDCEKVATHEVWNPIVWMKVLYVCKEHSRNYIRDGFYIRAMTDKPILFMKQNIRKENM